MTASEPAPILCHECGHDIDIHDWENGCPDCELGSLTSSRCILKPSDIAREYARQRVADEARVAAVVARDTRWNARHVDEQRVTRDAKEAECPEPPCQRSHWERVAREVVESDL